MPDNHDFPGILHSNLSCFYLRRTNLHLFAGLGFCGRGGPRLHVHWVALEQRFEIATVAGVLFASYWHWGFQSHALDSLLEEHLSASQVYSIWLVESR